MKTYRIGVIGAGSIARHCHMPGYQAADHCELIAVADPVAACRKEVREMGFKFEREYADYKEMLKTESLDAVSICTPNYLHKEIAVACIRKGVDVLLEKPMCLTMVEAGAIKRAAKKSASRVMVSFTHRFNELNVAAKNALKTGAIGKPYMYRIRFAHMGPWPGWARTDWFYRKAKAGGGAMMDMAIHAFDLIRWYAGEVTAVQGKVATLRKKIEVEDNCVALLELGPTCLGYIEAGWTSPAGFTGVEIMGDNGAIIVDYSASQARLTQGVTRPDGKTEKVETILKDGMSIGAWSAEMKHFTDTLATRKPFAAGIEDGARALKIARAVYRSSEAGRRVIIR